MIELITERLRYGGACKHGHVRDDGFNLRHINGGTCCRCDVRYVDLTDEEIQVEVISTRTYVHTKRKDTSPEAVKQRQVANSRRWQIKNPDKVREYVKKYNNKPEVKAAQKAKWVEYYASLTKEEKRALYETNRLNAKKLIDALSPEELAIYKESSACKNVEARRARQRATYAALTPEEKNALRIKRKQQIDAKKLRNLE